GFLRGWNAGNRYACQALKALGALAQGPVLALPAQRNAAFWGWNYTRKAFAQKLWDEERYDVFVPRILFLRDGERVVTACVWPALTPPGVRRVDRVIAGGSKLPEAFAAGVPPHPAIVSFDELCGALDMEEWELIPAGTLGGSPLDFLILFRAD